MKQGNRSPEPSEAVNAPAPRGARLDRALARTSDAPIREGNRLALLENGPNTYDEWLAAIGRARRWVHLENYIFESDNTGKRFAEALTEKVAEGIPVRVLYDWFGSMPMKVPTCVALIVARTATSSPSATTD